MILALEWTRPAGLLALVLPALLLFLARLLARPQPRATGALEVWERAGVAQARGGTRRRRRLPRGILPLALGLLCGALALGGPALEREPGGRLWTVIVDRSPGMGLAADGRAGATRLEVACAELASVLAPLARPGDRVRWSSPGLAPLERDAGEPIPDAFLRLARPPAPRPAWVWLDLPGAIWVTDRAPPVVPARAGLVRSGGATAPGLAAVEGATLFTWDGAALVPAGAVMRSLHIDPALPELVRGIAAAWAAAEQVALAPADGPNVDLALEAVAGPSSRAFRAGREGFALTGRPAAEGALPPGAESGYTTWLGAEYGLSLVAHRPGRVRVALLEVGEPAGDPAAFAVAWARLFEAALLPPAGLVPVEDRVAAGEPARLAPAVPPPPLLAAEAPLPLEALLTLAAALLGLLAAWRLAAA